MQTQTYTSDLESTPLNSNKFNILTNNNIKSKSKSKIKTIPSSTINLWQQRSYLDGKDMIMGEERVARSYEKRKGEEVREDRGRSGVSCGGR